MLRVANHTEHTGSMRRLWHGDRTRPVGSYRSCRPYLIFTLGLGLSAALLGSASVVVPVASHEQDTGRLAGRQTTTSPTSQPATPVGFIGTDQISYPDLVLLVKTARRAFREKITKGTELPPRYRPPALEGIQGRVHLTLRSDGGVLAEAESPEMPVLDAALAAGTRLADEARRLAGLSREERKPGGLRADDLRDGGDSLGLEFELMTSWVPVEYQYGENATWPESLLHAFEPAVEGIGVEYRGRRGWTRPSEVVSKGFSADLAIQAAEASVELRHADKLRFEREISYFRIPAYHLWQAAAHESPIRLWRGDSLVPDVATATDLDAAIHRLGDYLAYRQNSTGWFAHEYIPAEDRYTEGNSAVVQLVALQGLATYAAWSGDRDLLSKAQRGIRRNAEFLQPLSAERVSEDGRIEVVGRGLALSFPGHEDQLELSARLLLAMTALGAECLEPTTRPAGGSAATQPVLSAKQQMEGLRDGLLSVQHENGRLAIILPDHPEAATGGGKAAGWALAALCGLPEAGRDPRIQRAAQRALQYYSKDEETLAQPQAAAALARAFSLAYAATNDARVSDLVFSILDRFAALQVTATVCPWPDLVGAINVRELGVVGADTALYLAALADGALLADRIGDRARAEMYRETLRAAARFVMQLEVRESGCYCIRSPRDALGGVRAAPWDHRIRVDRCAEAVMALIRAREALYGPRPLRGR